MNHNVGLYAHCLSCALIIMGKNKEKLNLLVLISDPGLNKVDLLLSCLFDAILTI